jgi:hypothetical protein
MQTDGDSVSNPVNSFQLLRNFRFLGGIPVSRPGHTFAFNIGQEVYLLTSFPVLNPRTRLWLSVLGCFGSTIGTGARILHYDPDEDPKFQVYANYFAQSSRQSPMAVFGDDLYFGDKSLLRKPTLITAPRGTPLASLLDTPPDSPIYDFTGFTITWLKEFNGKLFIGLVADTAPNTTSKIAYWDGLSIKDDITGIGVSYAAESFRGIRLVVGFDATAGHVRHRDLSGTWATLALAGYSTSVSGNAMKEHRDGVSIAGGKTNLYRYTEPAGVPTLAVHRNIVAAAADGNGITCVTRHLGHLWYGWNEPAATYLSRLGRWDADNAGGATEFIDTYYDITNSVANFKGLFGLESYRQFMYLSGAAQWLLSVCPENIGLGVNSIAVVNDGGVPGAGINFPALQLLTY